MDRELPILRRTSNPLPEYLLVMFTHNVKGLCFDFVNGTSTPGRLGLLEYHRDNDDHGY
jgi:hypothetical protein